MTNVRALRAISRQVIRIYRPYPIHSEAILCTLLRFIFYFIKFLPDESVEFVSAAVFFINIKFRIFMALCTKNNPCTERGLRDKKKGRAVVRAVCKFRRGFNENIHLTKYSAK